jgi:hypothetical protein
MGVYLEAMESMGRWSSNYFAQYLRKPCEDTTVVPNVQASPDLKPRVSHEQMAIIR